MSDEFISEDEVSVSPRGRKVEIMPDLAATLKKVQPGKAVRLSATFGEVPKEKRATVSSVIRKHWRHVRADEPRIDYNTAGVPQVRVKQSK
jgi:hypothetical protein